MNVTESKWMGGKEMKVVSSITVMSRLAEIMDAKDLEAEGAELRTAIKKAYGKKLPDARKNLEWPGEKDHGIPAAFDTMVGDVNECCVAYGAVGSMIVSVEYREPRYALRDGKYELVLKGGVRLSICRAGWLAQ